MIVNHRRGCWFRNENCKNGCTWLLRSLGFVGLDFCKIGGMWGREWEWGRDEVTDLYIIIVTVGGLFFTP